jgi:hypothetical protein
VVVASVADVGLGAGSWDTWGGSEVTLGLSVLGSSKEEGVGTYYNILIRIEVGEEDISRFLKKRACRRTSRCEENKLVQSEALSTCLDNSGSCGFGESESGDGDLGNVEESNIVSDGADNDSDALGLGAEVSDES